MMARRVPLARRNLFEDRRRALLAVAGVSASMLLVLVLGGIFAGSMRQVTAYIRSSPADLFVSQSSVRTIHMSVSALPPEVVDQVRAVDGVGWVEPLYYTTSLVQVPDRRQATYVFGYETTTGRAGPRRITEGGAPRSGEAIIDEVTADELGLAIGNRVMVLGRRFTVSGLARGGTNIVNTIVYITAQDFRALRGPAVAYVLVGAAPGVNSADLAESLGAAVPGVTIQSRSEFADQERRIVRDMSADIMAIMTTVALLIGLAVVGLTLLALTLAKIREFGIVKALGASPWRLAVVVLVQASWLVALGIVVALVLAVGVASALASFTPNVRMVIEPRSVASTYLSAVVVGGAGALLPLWRVIKVDPASAFRRM